jgi:hypothetical protein
MVKKLIMLADVVNDKLKDNAALAYMEWAQNESHVMKAEDEDKKSVMWTRILICFDQEDKQAYKQ